MTTSFRQAKGRKQDKRSIGLMPGDRVIGKWNSHIYRIVRLLGQGANGVVYLVHQEGGPLKSGKQAGYALKMGFETMELQSEINALQVLESLKVSQAGPSFNQKEKYFIESDDAEVNGTIYPFYIMQYVQGKTLSKFLMKQGRDWVGLIGEKLLLKLGYLHQHQFVFGDLKPDNVMVGPYGEVSLIDYGGLTKEGDSIRQFTEWYDRGYWHAGTRKADFHYDLFAFAVMFIHMLSSGKLHQQVASTLPQLREREHLLAIASQCKVLEPYQPWLRRAIHQRFTSTEEAIHEWKRISSIWSRSAASPTRPTPNWLRWSFFASALLLFISLIFMMLNSSPGFGIK